LDKAKDKLEEVNVKVIASVLLALLIVGCAATNPPEAPEAKGPWYSLETDINAVKKGTY
jgi:hypothetical protein